MSPAQDADVPAHYDVIVVGAGTAGCVIARRFSDSGARILLLEAGPDVPPDDVPADVDDLYPRSYYNPAYAWPGLNARQQVGPQQMATPFTQAKVLGGGSSLMGMVALRGLDADYARWAERAPGWTPEAMREIFERLVNDRAPYGAHGSGPVQVRRLDPSCWPPFVAAVADACERGGLSYIDDMNRDEGDGYGPMPLSRTESGRVSSSSAFLPASRRDSENLVVMCATRVDRLTFSGTRCTGVVAESQGRQVRYSAGQVVLAAGAIFTPLLLQRSGIGDADDLRSWGIDVLLDRPAVGRNLQNHPVAYLATHIPRAARQPAGVRQGFIAGLRISTGIGNGVGDVMTAVLNKSSWHGLGESIGGMGVSLTDPVSRGRVQLGPGGSMTRPDIAFNFLSESLDRERMQRGFDMATELLADPATRRCRHEVFTAGYSGVVRALNAPGLRNALLTQLIAGMLNGPSSGRRAMLRLGMSTGDLSESRLRDSRWRGDAMLKSTFGTYHVAGTCAMGTSDDEHAVVDECGDVHGIEGLTVADASVMPTIPRANTNLPVQMTATRIADLQLGAVTGRP